MEKNKSIFIYKIVLIISIILCSIFILFHNFTNVDTLIGIEGIKLLTNHLYTRLISYALLGLSLFILSFSLCKIIILIDNKRNISNIKICLLIFVFIIIFLCTYNSKFNYFHFNINNNNFVEYIQDINLLSRCKKDVTNNDTYSIICNNIKINEYRTIYTGKHSPPDIIEYELELSSIDKTYQKSSILETVFITENDCNYIRQLQNSSYNSYYKITIYKNTKLIKDIELRKK